MLVSNPQDSPQVRASHADDDRPSVNCDWSMIRVALVEPEIPPNTGNIARLCAANRVPLHIVGATGFRLDDRAVRRAGLDYWPEVSLHRNLDLASLWQELPQARFIYLST